MIPKQLSQRMVLPAATAYGVFLLCVPKAAANGFAEGMSLCVNSVLPALFPFFVVSSLIFHAPGNRILATALSPLTKFCGIRSDDAPLILLLSWTGGYAVCARMIGEAGRRNTLSYQEASILLVLGCCSSPGFVIGWIGGLMLGNLRLGILLYVLQLAANFLSAAVLTLSGKLCSPPGPAPSPSGVETRSPLSLPQAISEAVDSSLSVCGCVLFFRVTISALEAVFPIQTVMLAHAGLCGIFEITSGCSAFAQLGGASALYGICFCLSGLGASVFAQIRFLAGNTVSLKWFAISRILHAFFLYVLTRICTSLLPGTLPVFTSLSGRLIISNRLPWDSAFLLFCFFCAVLYKFNRKNYNCR